VAHRPGADPAGRSQRRGLNNATSDLQAATNQMVYLLRTVGGRPQMPFMSTLVPHLGYSYLVLAAEEHLKLPARRLVSSENRNRLLWTNDPLGYDQGMYTPNLGTSVAPSINWRHPYSSDFRMPTCFFDLSPVGTRIEPSTTGTFLTYTTAQLAQTLLSSVASPSHKFMAGDYIARHMGPRLPYCTSDEARLPMIMADGSVEVRRAAEANLGCNPNSGQQIWMTYAGSAIDPPPSGPNSVLMPGRFLWTRQRLSGRDFRGAEPSGF
jgi:hypothetical protein